MAKMIKTKNKSIINIIILAVVLSVSVNCVYYNTFYHAQKSFNEAEKARKQTQYRRGGRRGGGSYTKAIEQSLKVVENHPNSKWYDDALFILGVSYYHTKKYSQAERRFREILINYPESKYVTESEVYLAKSKLKLDDVEDAMEIFQRIFNSDFDKAYKAEAAMGLGTYYFNDKNYSNAIPYFQAVRDSLGNDEEKKMAQTYIADGYYNRFKFIESLNSYLQILGMDPDNQEKYHIYYQAAICSYNLMKISDGMDYLQTLIDDDIYYDSLGALRLAVGMGYEYDNEIEMAEETYLLVAEDETNKKIASRANYRLGLINQFDYDNLVEAKQYYDKTTQLFPRTDIANDALERSSDIGKLDTYARKLVIDSATTQTMIDEAAYAQLQLAELYWFNLDKPDTAMLEMQYIIDSFPSAYDAPQAYISLSQMYRDYKADTAASDSLLNLVIEKYPKSDFIEIAFDVIGLKGTPADTGYSKYYLRKAENFLIDEENIDSARYFYNYIVENFPESDYFLQSKFALIWITETYQSPGDSSLIYAYQEIVDSFPASVWATQAKSKISYQPKVQKTDDDAVVTTTDTLIAVKDSITADSTTYMDPRDAVYFDSEGKRIELLPLQPVETRKTFEYPTEAYRIAWEGDLYFQIFLDFSGEVVDYILKIKCDSPDINREATETVASMIFDPLRIPPQLQGQWFVYKYRVRLPEHLR